MKATFKIWETNRKNLCGFFDKYSLQQLNTILAGYSNNLIWNLGHIVLVQQRLIYRLSGLPMHVADALSDSYGSGTKPNGQTSEEEVELLKGLMLSLVAQTIQDYEEGKFSTFKEITTSTGFNLATTEEAIVFNNYHEGLHLGLMMNIRKFI